MQDQMQQAGFDSFVGHLSCLLFTENYLIKVRKNPKLVTQELSLHTSLHYMLLLLCTIARRSNANFIMKY